MRRIYLDYAATAPLRSVARDAMLPYLSAAWNASSVHYEGRQARQALDLARETFASVFSVRSREIVFTASGSESISLALLGTMRALGKGGRIITSPLEHRAVLAAAAEMGELGWEHVLLDVDHEGATNLEQLESILAGAPADQPQLLSCMLVNNELGTINDIEAIARCARKYRAIVHCDAVGAGALVPFGSLPAEVDLLSLAAHKFGGPIGAGVLVIRAQTPLAPIVFGGGQEFGKRAGTENLTAIVGAAAALREVEQEREEQSMHVRALRDCFEAQICEALPFVRVLAGTAPRAPGITNLAIPGLEIDVLPVALDLAGVAASAGSACASGALKRSHVLKAIGYEHGAAIRFSWGSASTREDTIVAAQRFIDVVLHARTGPAALT